MNRLTRKHRHNSYTICTEIRNADLNKAIEKLGQLEDLQEELGCPLEVVFKALEEGICVKHNTLANSCYLIKLTKGFAFTYWSSFGVDNIYLKDYQKTWWLKGEK